jgi:hypothetical protein
MNMRIHPKAMNEFFTTRAALHHIGWPDVMSKRIKLMTVWQGHTVAGSKERLFPMSVIIKFEQSLNTVQSQEEIKQSFD